MGGPGRGPRRKHAAARASRQGPPVVPGMHAADQQRPREKKERTGVAQGDLGEAGEVDKRRQDGTRGRERTSEKGTWPNKGLAGGPGEADACVEKQRPPRQRLGYGWGDAKRPCCRIDVDDDGGKRLFDDQEGACAAGGYAARCQQANDARPRRRRRACARAPAARASAA